MKRLSALLITGVALAAPASAQFTQYAEAGVLQIEQDLYSKLDSAAAIARWRAGRLLVEPVLELRNVGVRTSVRAREEDVDGFSNFDTEAQPTATMATGLRGYLPLGKRSMWSIEALPEYTWNQDTNERSRFNGRVATDFVGEVGRLGFQFGIAAQERAEVFSNELEDQVNTRTDSADVTFTLGIHGGLGLYVHGSFRDISFRRDDLPAEINILDREETVAGAGLNYTTTHGAEIGLGVEAAEADFFRGRIDRSNESTARVISYAQANERVEIQARAAYRELEFTELGIEPDPVVTGIAGIVLQPRAFLGIDLFAHRNLTYSLNEASLFFLRTAYGIGVTPSLGRLGRLRVFGETGKVEYEQSSNVSRKDDLVSWGATLSFQLKKVVFKLGGRRTEYDSNLPEFDRSTTTITTGLGFAFGIDRSINDN